MNFLTKDIRLNPTHQQKNPECLPVLAQNLASHLASERSLAPQHRLQKADWMVRFISFFLASVHVIKTKRLHSLVKRMLFSNKLASFFLSMCLIAMRDSELTQSHQLLCVAL